MNQSCTYRIWFRFCDAILVILSSVLFAGLAFGQTSSLIQELLPNQTLEREMKGAETHRYKFDLKANEFFQVRVDQKGVDIALKLLDENGNVLATMDSPNGKEGFETLSYVAEQAGSFTLEVSGLDAKVDRGSYTIKREASRAATEKDKRRVEIEKVFVEGIKARGAEGQRGIAINKLKEALAGWEELSDDYLKELTVRQIEQMEIVAIFQGFYSDSANAAKTLKEAQTIMVKSRLDSLSAREKANEALSQFRALSSKLSDNTIIERITSLKNEDWLNALKELQLLTKAQGAYSLSAIAQTHYNLGEWQKRVDYLKQVVNINQELIANDYFKNSTNLHDNYFLVKVNQANEFLSIGQMLYVLGQLDEAMEFYNQALQSYRSLFQETQSSDFKIDKALFNFKLQEALVLKEMGNTYSRSSENRTKAIASYSKAVEIYKGFADNKRETAKGLFLIADKYALDLNYEAALRTIEESLKYFEELDDKSGQAGVLELKGILYFWLNDKTKANDIFNKIIRILQSPDFNENDKKNRFSFVLPGALQEKVDDAIERERLDGIATAYKFLENFQKSNEFYEKSLAIARSNQDNRIVRTTLRLIAFNYASLKQWDEAAEYYQQAVSISRTDKAGEELADDLRDLGWTLLEAGKYKEALQYQNEALIIYQSVGVAENKGFTQNYSGLLNELSRTHYALDNKRLAIFYGKRAVNAMQGERQRLQNLDLISQRGFLERKEKHYRRLADWLIAEGRIAEAEQVLALFKQDEYFDSLPLNKKLEVIESQAMDKILLSDAERDAFNRYEEIANHLAAVGKEYDALEKKSKNFEAGKFSEQARLDKLSKELAQAGTVFNRFLEELDVRFRNLPPNPSTQVSYSRTLLRKINQPRTVIVSTIVGQERLNLIVTTARTYRAYPVEIKAANLNKLVIEFREAVKNPKADPRPAGKKLYDVLFPAGLQRDLANVKADTIVWSLDGTLRYAPIAALWDGKQYLIERYANSVITLASRDKLNQPLRRRANWTALGVGVSQEGKVRDFDGTELSFVALPAVPQELCGVINDPQKRRFCAELTKGRPGILNGRNLSDGEFTLQSLKLNFGKYPVVHIASHFRLNPGNENTSYLLLGGKNAQERKLTLAAARDELGRKFEGVELLTLSACNTAMGGGDKGNGAEVESFGALAQNLGAKTVIATLWPVNDASTRDMMIEFYREMKVNRRIGKAEALRKAQLLLLRGEYKAGEIPMWRRGLRISKVEGNQTPSFEHDNKARYAHPYFWSPFVLMGNWR